MAVFAIGICNQPPFELPSTFLTSKAAPPRRSHCRQSETWVVPLFTAVGWIRTPVSSPPGRALLCLPSHSGCRIDTHYCQRAVHAAALNEH